MQKVVKAGKWVEIEFIIIPAHERSTELPKDTQKVDYTARIKGYLVNDSKLGQEVTIQSIHGRELKGKLTAVNPAFPATFGAPVPELMEIGSELKTLIAEYEENN